MGAVVVGEENVSWCQGEGDPPSWGRTRALGRTSALLLGGTLTKGGPLSRGEAMGLGVSGPEGASSHSVDQQERPTRVTVADRS